MAAVLEWRITGKNGLWTAEEESTVSSDKTLRFGVGDRSLPPGKVYELLSIAVYPITSATVGNRKMAMQGTTPLGQVFTSFVGGTNAIVAASSSTLHFFFYAIGGGFNYNGQTYSTEIMLLLPQRQLFSDGDQLRVYDFDAIDAAADNFKTRIRLAERNL